MARLRDQVIEVAASTVDCPAFWRRRSTVETATGKMISEQVGCPICQSTALTEFLSRKQVPVHQNLLMRDQAAAVDIPRGDLALLVCCDCGFIFNRAFDPQKIMYGADYENNQACSPSFNEYLDGLARHMILERDVRDCAILEVGCGNGDFLRRLVTYEESENRGFGFDPSYVGNESELNGRLKFVTRYYGTEFAEVPADVIVCRHVIEHVPRPLELLRDIKNALGQGRAARLFFETPCVGWILKNQVIWDFFYEHCSYFTAASLTTAFQSAGFNVESVRHVFGGQYLWLEATLSTTDLPITKQPGTVCAQAQSFASSELQLRQEWNQKIRALSSKEKVALWGAGGKGVTFANLVDHSREWIDCVVDLNPLKQGHYVPGTGHPIVNYQALTERGVSTAILMNPNYRAENEALLREVHADIRLIEQL